jgi:hypothetical protein
VHGVLGWHYDFDLPDDVRDDHNVVITAARSWASLFDNCENCAGTGEMEIKAGVGLMCSACNGRGYDLNQDRYDRAIDAGQNGRIEAALIAFLDAPAP